MAVKELSQEVVEFVDEQVEQASIFIRQTLLDNHPFTGKLEVNFKDGMLMDINKTERTKF